MGIRQVVRDAFPSAVARLPGLEKCVALFCSISLTGIRFPVVKLWDYNRRWTELEASVNPFAVVVMAHLKNLETRRNPDARFYWKTYLVRRLYKDGYEHKDALRLLRFIDWVMILPEELAERFDQEHQRLEEEVKMRYVTTWERKGEKKGAASTLKRLLAHRFNELPGWVEQRLQAASQKDLEHWAVRVLEAKRLEDVFASV